MNDDIHALILIATLIATSIILIKYASPKKTWGKCGIVILRLCVIFVFFNALAPNFTYRFAKGGYASSQYLITGLCICLISILVHKRRIMYISIGILICINVLLCKHYMLLVKGPQFIGKKGYSVFLERGNYLSLHLTREELSKEGESDKYYYPEGWLSDVINKPEQKKLRRYSDSTTVSKQHDLWHSWLTGLYSTEESEISLWYPGGMLEA
jgi:hypothetical protein